MAKFALVGNDHVSVYVEYLFYFGVTFNVYLSPPVFLYCHRAGRLYGYVTGHVHPAKHSATVSIKLT